MGLSFDGGRTYSFEVALIGNGAGASRLRGPAEFLKETPKEKCFS